MERLQFSFVAGLLICLLESYLALEKCTAKWCTTSKLYSRRVKTYTSCWSWNWFSCSEYSTKHYYKLHCCTGYGYYGNSPCVAACSKFRLPDTYGGCNLKYSNDSVPDRSSSKVERNSGGTCVSPNQCGCCNKGFYADYSDGYCKICPYIPMCDYRNCHSPHGHENECVYCKYENDHKRFERAYKYNNITNACEKTCSWRPDSTRCFPGYCSDEYADTCVCTEGFGSPSNHCIEITKAIDVLHAQVIFMDAENTTVSSPENVNSPRNVPKKWTNNRQLNTMEFSLGAIYNATGNIPKFGEHTDTINGKILTHYVTEFKYGIISGGMKAMLIRDHVATVSIFNENCQINMTLTSPFPVKSEFRCQKSLKFADQFRHNDELTILVELENGGYYVYENRDDRHRYKIVQKWPTLSVNLKGIKTVESYKIHWDTELPYYYCIKSFCDSLPLYVPDTSKSRVIDVHWNKWSDDLSGVDYYEIEVFELETAGLELRENTAPVMHVKSLKGRSSKVEVTKPGIYAVHLFCFDMAGNYETARAFVLYDNNDTIDLGKGQIKVKNTKYYLERRWITDSSPLIEVEWKDIFIKTDHVKYKWLATVQPHPNILSTYDDISGKRTVKSVPNVKGIVRFEIVHDVYGTKLKSSSKFTVVSNVYAQFTVRNVTWDDGDQLKTTIRAFDILENYRDETIITYKDSTPPVISNLWLTKGDRIDTAVHSLKELNEMTIEWDAYDYHSGISHLKWRLYSNYSGINIIHGEIDLPGQGETQNFTECEEKYNVTRGPACYCTKYTGCYQKHFYIRPNIVVGEGNGIVHNKSMGEHNLDYFIDVNVTNMATLISLKTIRITVDTTPPEVGHVHDGVYGSPEVDFQQDMRLDAHWEGFFDHESGVAFYQYEFSDVCLTEEYFQRKSLINDTINTFATYDAPSPGTYYITVVAYNKAFHMSKPVCSDSVTIITTIPSVKNVIIMNARTKPRIVRETDGHEWYIDETLQRHYLENSTSKCKFSDPLTENIEVFPISQSPVYADNVCMKTNSYSTLVTRVVPKIHMLNITWESVVDASLIDDYEVGFSKVSGSTAPELMAFQSSKHHTHILINHFGVPEGMLFFIIIKSISKSNVKGSQSVGPFILDTTPPQFVGTYIDLYLSGNNLLANWSAASFIDSDNPFSLDYEYALGHEPYSADIQHYSLVPEEGSCSINSNYICIATDITELDWKLHGHHKYYVTIKATNLAGLFVLKASVPYIHDIVLPSKGIVIDVPGNSSTVTPIKDMEDIDYTTIRDHLAIRWRKFYHPHLNLTYYACVGTASGICDVAGKRKIGSNINFYLVTGLSLYPLLRYYSTVFAETLTGSASVSSDGVTIVDPNWSLPDLKIHDGENCTDSLPLNASHHDQDTRPNCTADKEFQVSTSVLGAYFRIPFDYIPYITHAFWSIDERHWLGDFWSTFNEMNYQYISINENTNLTARDLSLEPGRTYRSSMKFCADEVCFPALTTSGVTVIPSKPVAGPISIEYTNHTNNTDKMEITFANMYDPDIVDEDEARSVILYYEYSLQDSSKGIYHSWLNAEGISAVNSSFSKFTMHMLGQIDFSKCRIFALRGYNRAGVWQTAFAEIKPCNGQDIVPNIVVDATGEQQLNEDGSIIDGYGKEIHLEETGGWNTEDVDYTPYRNILSAVWHSLQHDNFTWAVIEIKTLDTLTYYKDFNSMHLSDPCSHPDVVTCGHTENAYINVLFKDEISLEHGKRYTICIHAHSKTLQYETYTAVLEETNSCSDGITVDLTPPSTGKVWIGPTTEIQYKFQITTSDIFVNWESFVDIEGYHTASHSTGIRQYQVAIGSVEGGTDIVEYTNVGVLNHVTFHNLHLQNGHNYFASVKGVDFSERSSTAHSASVRVDNTPPHLTSKPILIDGRHIRNFTEIQACWKDVFYDLESGIRNYILEVGSKANTADIVQSIETTEDCGVPIQFSDIDTHQGHAYFLIVKAVNNANLVTTASSWGYIYDKTPPEVGQVFDGFLHDDKSIDIDFQIDTTQLGAYWEEFYDPHTTIKTYTISVGTCVGCDDVLKAHDVGIIYEFVLKGINLAFGRIYYTTVTACNTADLCSSDTSDGFIIDNSSPNIGKIKDGVDYIDINYQSLRSYVAATWRGFNDPQSGLDKYSIRVGSLKGGDNIIPMTELPLTDIAVFSNITDEIPTNIRIYITVRSYNKAGLYSEATSNGFLVDDSPPSFSRKPKLFQQLGSRRENSTIYRSCLKITWDVSDDESYIERQYISVTSHKGGGINSTSTELNGIVRDFTYTRLNLNDGGEYFVTIIACNGAKVCVKETSNGILVDNSPPITGTFAIETDHAASLNRHVDGWWMKWSTFKLWLAWIGFSDLHSDIDYYMVSVGSRYMLDDLNSENKPHRFQHSDDGVDKKDEGKVQTFEVKTKKLTGYEYVFISVWAFNKVGLQSDMIHSQFRLIPGGSLELIRQCSSDTCLGHCVCAPKDHRCPIKGLPCVDNTQNNTNTLIAIYDVTDIRNLEADDINFTPSHDALAARWRIVQIQGLMPQWYEWSVGITDSNEPEGIIDSSVENVWHPCGQIDNAIYTLPRGNFLNDNQVYSFFVRVWYDSNTFADFKSDGVTVMSKPLTTTKVFGVGVMEHLPDNWKKDIDYMLRGGLFTVSWHGIFLKASTVIERFHVYLSTNPGGHDMHKVEIDIPGSVTTVNISRVPLVPGVRYYSNVVGYSYAGQHVTLSSDGFTVDIDKPLLGVVNDGIGYTEIDFQNSSHSVSASWNGFSDQDSGIRNYYWCVQLENSETGCDVLPYQHVGIHRSVSKSINSSIIHSGAKVLSKVYAVDFVGHVSDTATSNGFVIDETPPTPVQLVFTENSLVLNPSFEDGDNDFVDISNISSANICRYTKPYHWNSSDQDCICVLGSSKSIAMDGRSFLFLRGSVLQTLHNLEIDISYSVKFFTAHVPFEDSVLSTKEGYIEFGNERHVFLVYQKQDKYGSDIEVSWHSHTFYFTAKNKDVNITYGSMDDTTGILIDNIQFSKVEVVDVGTHPYPVLSHAVWLHEWSSIHAFWYFVDKESPIVEYLWAIGYKEGSTEIQRYTSVGLNTFAYSYNITLAHTSQLHITVVAINGAGLSAVATAESLFIDLTPPDIEFVYDGIGYDIDNQITDEIIVNWKVEDLESGLSHCEWAVGLSEFGNEIQAFVRIPTELSYVSKVFEHSLLSSKTVYVTLRCHNKAGLHSKKSSDGVTISDSPPSIQNAQVQILDQPMTEYGSKQNFHGNTSIVRLKWMGFEDRSGLDSFHVEIENQNKTVSLSKTILYDLDGAMYYSMTGLDLHDGQHEVRVSAINNAFLSSQPVSTHLSVSTITPKVSGTKSITMSEKNRTLTISWDAYFTFAFTLYYEVSVGTALNGADIVQWQETTNEFLVMHVPLRVKFYSGMDIYITITAIGLNGKHITQTITLTV